MSFCHWWGMDKAPETDCEPLLEHMTSQTAAQLCTKLANYTV